MTKIRKNIFLISFLISILFLSSCAAGLNQSAVISPTPIAPVSSDTPAGPVALEATQQTEAFIISTRTSAIRITPTLPRIIPTRVDASETLHLEQISSQLLGKIGLATIALDDDFIYWVVLNGNAIFRKPLQGGATEQIATSDYPDGRLDYFSRFQVSEGWLVVCDMPMSNNSIWKIRAINTKNSSDIELLTDENGKNIVSMLDFSLDGHRVIWTVATATPDRMDINEMVITMVNLETGEKRELMRAKIDGSIWPILSLSGDQAVIEQDFEDTKGGGSTLHMMNVIDGTMKDLSLDGRSTMPRFVYPWVVWKYSARFAFAHTLVIRNVDSGLTYSLLRKGIDPSDPKLDGTRVYWTEGIPSDKYSMNEVHIYDIEENKLSVLAPPGDNHRYRTVVIHGNTIAWVRKAEATKAVSDIYLEWTTFR